MKNKNNSKNLLKLFINEKNSSILACIYIHIETENINIINDRLIYRPSNSIIVGFCKFFKKSVLIHHSSKI